MKQRCPVLFLYLAWVLYIGGVVFFLFKDSYRVAIVWLFAIPLLQWVYVSVFPSISRFIGYGSVKDRVAATDLVRAPIKVTLYIGLGCPFCPIVKQRLKALQLEMKFELDEIDVTLKPSLLKTKGIYALPVVEVGDKHLTGHATSEQLAAFIVSNVSP